MTIDEIKTGDKTAVPVDDLVQRSSSPPRHENGMLVTDGDIQILRLNLRDETKRCDDLNLQIGAKDKEIAVLKESLAGMGAVMNEVQAQRNAAQDQAAQFGAIVMAMRRKYEPQGA